MKVYVGWLHRVRSRVQLALRAGAGLIGVCGLLGCAEAESAEVGARAQGAGLQVQRPVILVNSGVGGPQPDCSSAYGPSALWAWGDPEGEAQRGTKRLDAKLPWELETRIEGERLRDLPVVPPQLRRGPMSLQRQLAILQRYAAQMDAVLRIEKRVKAGVFAALKGTGGRVVPFVLSGAHTTAAGSIAGAWAWARESHRAGGLPAPKVGVIWVDAHADINTPDTSPSGNPHGVPLAKPARLPMRRLDEVLAMLDSSTATGLQRQELTSVWHEVAAHWSAYGTELLDGQAMPLHDLAYVGVRDTDPAETALLEQTDPSTGNKVVLNVTVDQVRSNRASVSGALRAQLGDVDYVVLNVDIDVLDKAISQGTGTAVDHGLLLHELQEVLEIIIAEFGPKLLLVEMTEVDPGNDAVAQGPLYGATLRHATEVVQTMVSALESQTTPR
jgi:arginase